MESNVVKKTANREGTRFLPNAVISKSIQKPKKASKTPAERARLFRSRQYDRGKLARVEVYLSLEDRQKLGELAEIFGLTASKLVSQMIRNRWED